MKSQIEREQELRALLQTSDGMLAIINLYQQQRLAHSRPGGLGRIGLVASEMIPRIVEMEFSGTKNEESS